jgi:uncharacterized membrane protein
MTSSPNKSRIAVFILGGIGLAYPFLVYSALGRVPAGAVVLVALALIGARLGLTRGSKAARFLIPVMIAVFVATAGLALLDSGLASLVYPVLMSLGMAAAFGLSLRREPSLVEVFASLTDPDPSPAAKAYMRKVTLGWFMVLLMNAMISAVTVVLGDMVLWALYNGLISYLLMGTFMAVEYAIRRRVRMREWTP